MMNLYALHGKLKAISGEGEQLASILLEAADMMSTAPGCRLYVVSKDSHHKETIWITEIWDSKDHHDDSLKREDVRQLIGRAMPILDGPPEKGQVLQVLGGTGL